MLVLFYWVWNLAKSCFSGFANFLAIFLGSAKFPLFFGVWQISSYFFWVFQFLYHTLESFEWRTYTTEKHKIIVAFIFIQTLTNIASWVILFFGFEFLGILFLWVVEICSRTKIPVKEMLVCPPPPTGRFMRISPSFTNFELLLGTGTTNTGKVSLDKKLVLTHF